LFDSLPRIDRQKRKLPGRAATSDVCKQLCKWLTGTCHKSVVAKKIYIVYRFCSLLIYFYVCLVEKNTAMKSSLNKERNILQSTNCIRTAAEASACCCCC
jgi:hypothetical protein